VCKQRANATIEAQFELQVYEWAAVTLFRVWARRVLYCHERVRQAQSPRAASFDRFYWCGKTGEVGPHADVLPPKKERERERENCK